MQICQDLDNNLLLSIPPPKNSEQTTDAGKDAGKF